MSMPKIDLRPPHPPFSFPMKKLFLIVLTLASTTAFSMTDAPPVNTEVVLKELQKLKGTHDVSLKNQLYQIYQMVNSAASNGNDAMDLYLQAEFATQFNGQSRDKVQFQEWKKKQSDKLKSKSFQESLRLYLTYLAITIQSSMGAKTVDLIQPLINYSGQVFTEQEFLEDGDELMKKPLDGSLIVRYLNLNLTPQTGWVNTPGNVDDIYLKVILPELRILQNPMALEYWDRQITKEAETISNDKRIFQSELFNNVRKPTLYWNKAMEFYLIGQKNRGITEMLAVIKAYPNHPDAAGWVSKLEQYINPPKP